MAAKRRPLLSDRGETRRSARCRTWCSPAPRRRWPLRCPEAQELPAHDLAQVDMRAWAEVARDHALCGWHACSRCATSSPTSKQHTPMWGPIAATRSPAPAITLAQARDPGRDHVLLGPLPPAVDRESGAALAIAYETETQSAILTATHAPFAGWQRRPLRSRKRRSRSLRSRTTTTSRPCTWVTRRGDRGGRRARPPR